MEEKKGLFEKSFEVRQLIDDGKDIKEGEIWTYESMSKKLGFDVRTNRGKLGTARKFLQSDLGMIFQSVTNEGLKRLNNTEKVFIADSAINRTHNIVHKAKKSYATIDYSLLPEKEKNFFTANATIFQFTDKITNTKTISKIKLKIETSKNILSFSDTLKLFEDGK